MKGALRMKSRAMFYVNQQTRNVHDYCTFIKVFNFIVTVVVVLQNVALE